MLAHFLIAASLICLLVLVLVLVLLFLFHYGTLFFIRIANVRVFFSLSTLSAFLSLYSNIFARSRIKNVDDSDDEW